MYTSSKVGCIRRRLVLEDRFWAIVLLGIGVVVVLAMMFVMKMVSDDDGKEDDEPLPIVYDKDKNYSIGWVNKDLDDQPERVECVVLENGYDDKAGEKMRELEEFLSSIGVAMSDLDDEELEKIKNLF